MKPKASDVEAAFFDICYEYGAGRLAKSDYEKKYNDYNEVRKRPTDSASRATVVTLPILKSLIWWGSGMSSRQSGS